MKTHDQAAEALDLSAFLPADTAVLELVRPGTTTKIGWKVTFAGPSHPKAVAWNNDAARQNLIQSREIELARLNGKKYVPAEQDVEAARRDNVRWVVARIVDWTPVKLSADSPTVSFSEQGAVELLMRPEMTAFYGQMLEFLNGEQSFTKASATP